MLIDAGPWCECAVRVLCFPCNSRGVIPLFWLSRMHYLLRCLLIGVGVIVHSKEWHWILDPEVIRVAPSTIFSHFMQNERRPRRCVFCHAVRELKVHDNTTEHLVFVPGCTTITPKVPRHFELLPDSGHGLLQHGQQVYLLQAHLLLCLARSASLLRHLATAQGLAVRSPVAPGGGN